MPENAGKLLTILENPMRTHPNRRKSQQTTNCRSPTSADFRIHFGAPLWIYFLARKQKRALAHPLLPQRHRRAFVLFLKTFNLRESVHGNAFNPRVSIHAKPAHEVSVLRKKLAAHLSVRPITRAFVRPN